MGQPQREYHTREGKRNCEHNHKRLLERLELARHHDVHQHDNQYAQHRHVAEGVLLVFVVAGDTYHYALRDV